MEEKKDLTDEVILLKKKTDNLSQKIQAVKNQQTDSNSNNRGPTIDPAKFVDVNSFAEFIKHNNKEIEGVSFRSEELKRIIDDILTSIKDKITIKEVETSSGMKLHYLQK